MRRRMHALAAKKERCLKLTPAVVNKKALVFCSCFRVASVCADCRRNVVISVGRAWEGEFTLGTGAILQAKP
ncbi:hypothetical protein DL89DRAFT_113313 [Linderina pennispora]|uniref:Uncharacterized protein n=1 Tax=Linderina pennispora TaxID=61395 RepID=A0A1Y1WFX0_9FUNG|nr:uncharacterized protein DL89DRAFT_113313 [Linderina pennispora]ORX72450.1 hypothetical protein DL89DRAFT_113313 [Linderina pennispora]